MKIGKHKISRKAISPVIAVLLMIAIAVAAAILVYTWSMGLVGSLQGTGGQQTREQFILEAYDATDLSGTITWTLYLRNVGPTTSTIAAVYVEGKPATLIGGSLSLTPGQSGTQRIRLGFTPASGTAYTIKVVTTSGAVFSYSVIAGRAA